MDIRHDANSIRLTSSEIAYLWAFYALNSPAKYIISYIVEKCKDEDIRSVMQSSVDLSNKILEGIKVIYNSVNLPIPYGFNEKDVNIKGDNLFSDTLWLSLLKSYTLAGLSNYGIALPMAGRSDVKQFMTNCLTSAIELSNKIDEIALQKGIFVRTPYIQIPENIEFAHHKSILGSFIGHKRTLNCMEIAQVFNTSMINRIGEALLTGLSQIISNQKIRDFMVKGRRVLKEHAETLDTILVNEYLNTPQVYNTEVLNATTSPFSDRISLFFAVTMITNILSVYSVAKLSSMRKDIFLTLTQLSSEAFLYLKDGIDIMIENGWFEEQPQNVDHEDITANKY